MWPCVALIFPLKRMCPTNAVLISRIFFSIDMGLCRIQLTWWKRGRTLVDIANLSTDNQVIRSSNYLCFYVIKSICMKRIQSAWWLRFAVSEHWLEDGLIIQQLVIRFYGILWKRICMNSICRPLCIISYLFWWTKLHPFECINAELVDDMR